MCLSLPGDLSVQRSRPNISANNVEPECWRTLLKIRCIIQVVVLFSFLVVIQATPPGGFKMGYTALMCTVGGEEKSIISPVGKSAGIKNQLDF